VSFALWRATAAVVALLAFLAVGMALQRVPTARLTAISRVEYLQLLTMGAFVAGTTVSLFFAFERTSIATVLIVFYTFPLWVAIAAVPVFGEHLGRDKLIAIVIAASGLVLLLAAPGAGEGVDIPGVLLALVASFCQVGFALVGSGGFRSVPPLQAATLLRSLALAIYGLVLVPVVIVVGQGATVLDPLGAPVAWALVLAAGVIGAAIPAVLVIAGYRRVGPTRGAVLMLVEPVTGVVLAAFLLAEQPTWPRLVGGVLVLAGAALVQRAPVSRPGPETRVAAEP